MKKLLYIFPIAVIALTSLFTACSPENEQELPQYSPSIFFDDFEWFTQGNTEANTWTNDVVKGTKPWKFETRSNNSYLYFSGYASGGAVKDVENESWIISKAFNIDQANLKRLTFISTQGYVTDVTKNDLELYVIHNITETSADSVKLNFNKPIVGGSNFKWVNSGIVSLADFKGNIKIAFRATGSGTDTSADGTYEVDNIKVF
ncbi:hypothetical protein P3875_09910 [Myroides sp. JBRI-B21084]|uniref:hypothetical protein n=1 Tax=Myroides sp. JBRI-B21084 TaxID=3119977 RepID=UPI0026E3F8A6|nr:hypothetical protein [Paenimyroides cloacae]WKW46091.1 hypothetical protein P3875_09910 [Paenimyroides cloacae]